MRNLFRILVIADAGLVRDGLCSLLDLQGYAEIIGAIDNTSAIGEVVRRPHLVVLDTHAPDDNGTAEIAAIKARWPHAKLIVLTAGRGPRTAAEEHARPDANARFPKTHSGREFLDVVRAVLEAERHQAGLPAMQLPEGRSQQNPDGLSEREREVMKQIARGFRTREIAVQLSLSEKTIEKHRGSLMRKLGLRTATAVAAYAIANGYVEPP